MERLRFWAAKPNKRIFQSPHRVASFVHAYTRSAYNTQCVVINCNRLHGFRKEYSTDVDPCRIDIFEYIDVITSARADYNCIV